MKCVAHPVSWLTLEQYRLRELPPEAARTVAAHLEICPACAACVQAITADERPMLPLPEVVAREGRPLWSRPRLVTALAAAAAVIAVLLVRPFVGERPDVPPDRVAYRGGELAITLVRERGGAVVENPTRYVSGDRFKVLATVPGRAAAPWDLVVFQDREAFFPLSPGGEVAPGSDRPLPGAFRITGASQTEICLYIGRPLPGRDRIRKIGRGALPEAAVCRTLAPAGAPAAGTPRPQESIRKQ